MSATDAAAALVRTWTRLYSLGVRAEVRAGRRAEIESDLWEHTTEAASLGAGEMNTAADVLGRMLRGMPADIAWRVQMGGLAMGSVRNIERASGLVMLLVVLLFFGAVSGPGLGGSDPYFTSDFPAFAAQRDDHLRAVAAQLALGVAILGAAALLYRTFRAEARSAAMVGSAALTVAGLLFLVAGGAGIWLHQLASDWAASGAAGDATWDRAQVAARIVEGASGLAAMSFALSFAAFGIVIARRRMLPRGIGWLAVMSGIAALAALVALGVSGDAAWYLLMIAMFTVLVSFTLTAAWLVLRGARRPSPRPPAV